MLGAKAVLRLDSPGLEGGCLLVVEILGASLHLIPLLLLSGPCAFCDFAQLAFVLAIGQHLLSAKVFLLHGPHTLLICLLLFQNLRLAHLHFSLKHNCSFLLLVHSLEVIRLDAMGCKHRLLSRRVFSHEVVVISILNVCLGLKQLVGSLSVVSVALFLRQL